MSCLFYEVPVLDDEGNQFAEFDATLIISIELENGEPIVYVDGFEVEVINERTKGNERIEGESRMRGSAKGKVKCISSLDDDPIMRTLFFRAKDYLEKDTDFQNYALSKSDEVEFIGRGAHAPDGHFVKHDPDDYFIKQASDGCLVKISLEASLNGRLS